MGLFQDIANGNEKQGRVAHEAPFYKGAALEPEWYLAPSDRFTVFQFPCKYQEKAGRVAHGAPIYRGAGRSLGAPFAAPFGHCPAVGGASLAALGSKGWKNTEFGRRRLDFQALEEAVVRVPILGRHLPRRVAEHY